jgi:methionyl-tRNA synthetase
VHRSISDFHVLAAVTDAMSAFAAWSRVPRLNQLPTICSSVTLRAMSKRFYITTAIDYLNGQPHLGHAYEKIVTDVIARVRRSLGQEVFYLTGLDEHGQKVQQAAVAEGKEPQAYCDELAQSFRALWQSLGITHDDFVRTTEARHKEFVQAILSKLHAEGQFYTATYKGFYSTKEETFLTDKDRLPDGTFDPAYGEVIELEETNYWFKLRDHQQWLIDYLAANPSFVQPDYRRNEVLGFLKNNVLEDLCISRPAARLNWGIPLPFDASYVTYVWFDALVNYISIPAAHGDPLVCRAVQSAIRNPQSAISLWPADIHVIGKDILKFHAVFWPIMLKAMGLPLPKQILVHGWWQKDGAKISKSTGNIVDPVAVIAEWGVDAFRFYVLRELDIGPDGNWTDAGFKTRYAAELANGLGNLVNRSLSMLKRYRNGIVPEKPLTRSSTTLSPSDGERVEVRGEREIADDAAKIITETLALLEKNELQAALQTIWSLVDRGNLYVEQTKPFKLAKDPAQAKRLDEVLYNLAEVCRVLAVLLWPFLPGTAGRIFAQLGLNTAPDKLAAASWGGLAAGHAIGQPEPLFPRKDV